MGSIEGIVSRSSRIQGVMEGSGSSSSTRLNTLNLEGKNVFSFICWHVPDHEVETTGRTELFYQLLNITRDIILIFYIQKVILGFFID